MKNITLLWCLLGMCALVQAQDKYIQAGDRLLEKLDFLGALEKYQISYIYNEDYLSSKRIGAAYFAMQRFAEAANWQKKILRYQESEATDYLDYAKTLIKLDEDQQALAQVEQYLLKTPDDESAKKLQLYLKFKLDGSLASIKGRDMNAAYCIKLVANNDSASIGPDVRYEWTFDDGTIKKGNAVQHCFKQAGEHSVKLTSIDKTFDVLTTQDTVFPLFFLENVNFGLEGLRWVNAAVKLDARDQVYKKGVYGVLWQTGDGNISSEEVYTHKYLKKGNYTITLTILAIDENKNIFPASSITRTWNVIER